MVTRTHEVTVIFSCLTLPLRRSKQALLTHCIEGVQNTVTTWWFTADAGVKGMVERRDNP